MNDANQAFVRDARDKTYKRRWQSKENVNLTQLKFITEYVCS